MQDRTQPKPGAPIPPDTLLKGKSNSSFLENKTSHRLQNPKNSNMFMISCYSISLSFQMMAIISTAYWAGLKLDQYFYLTYPLFSSLLALGAIVLRIYVLIRKITKI